MSHPSYFLNLCGVKLSEEQMEKIPFPRFELTAHVTMKSVQALGLAGCLAAPVVSYVKGERDLESVEDRAFEYGKTGMLAGLVLGSVSAIPFFFKDGVYLKDTCYRIRFNENQLFVDRSSLVGLFLGIGVARYSGKDLKKGAVLGFICGFFVATIFNIGVWNPMNLLEKMNLI